MHIQKHTHKHIPLSFCHIRHTEEDGSSAHSASGDERGTWTRALAQDPRQHAQATGMVP